MAPPKEVSKLGEFFSFLYRKYNYRILPHISHIRGMTRLKLILRNLATMGLEKVDKTEENIFDREFENLVILDACRHDLFEEVEGETDCRITKESHSRGFIRENFSEGDYSDYVVITANPFFEDEIFKQVTGRKLESVFHTVFKTFETKWDEELKTIKPESVIEDTKTAEKLFPDKKKIIWFMQPHYPFINLQVEEETGQHQEFGQKGSNIWEEAEKGNYTKDEIWESYKENLEYVLTHTEKLSETLNGDTLLTSDHGNLVGEK